MSPAGASAVLTFKELVEGEVGGGEREFRGITLGCLPHASVNRQRYQPQLRSACLRHRTFIRHIPRETMLATIWHLPSFGG